MVEPDELLSISQVLAELGGERPLARSTFYRWCATGRGPKTLRLPNGKLRVWRSDLRAWLEARAA